MGSPDSHVFIASKDDCVRISRYVDAVIAEFAHEAAVPIVDSSWHSAQVVNVVVERVAVDVVDDVTFWNRTNKGEVLKAGKEHVAVSTAKFQIPRGVLVVFLEWH